MVKFFINKTEEKMKKIEKQLGISQILVLVIMAVLAIALPVGTKLVQQIQDTRSSAVSLGAACSSHGALACSDNKKEVLQCAYTSAGNYWKYQSINRVCNNNQYCSNGKCLDGKCSSFSTYSCIKESECVTATSKGALDCGSLRCCQKKAVCGDAQNRSFSERPTTSTTGLCSLGSPVGIYASTDGDYWKWTCSNPNVSQSCQAKRVSSSSSGCTSSNCGGCSKENCPSGCKWALRPDGGYSCQKASSCSPSNCGGCSQENCPSGCKWALRPDGGYSCQKASTEGVGTGAEACVAKIGQCQTNNGKMPSVGAKCSVNGGTNNGTYQKNLCAGQYNNAYRCCVPGSAPAPAPAAPAPAPAAPAQICSPGVTQCSGATLQLCNSAGSAWSNQYCTYGCVNNACNSSPGCTPNCNGKCGGDNGCGGTCANDCSGEQSCVNNVCVSKVNGACGANNGKSLVDSPTTDLCSLGIASGVTAGDSGYSWTCAGDASTVNCSATKTSLKLSFRMTFNGITSASTCLNNFKSLALTVGKVGENVTQDVSVIVSPISGVKNDSGLQVFEVSNIPINNTLAGSSNIYVKAKGSLHGRMFYCKNNQSSKYLGQVCDLVLDGSVNDFSKYPMVAGDINQDGVINTIDFSLMKNQSGSDKTVCDQSGDITGDGKVNNFDLSLIKNALSYKDDE